MPSADAGFVCRDCQRSFTFSAEERSEYDSLGRTHPPSRCPECREERKTRQEQTGRPRPAPGFRERRDVTYTAICSSCGKPAILPFAVRADRAAYCSTCFERRRASATG